MPALVRLPVISRNRLVCEAGVDAVEKASALPASQIAAQTAQRQQQAVGGGAAVLAREQDRQVDVQRGADGEAEQY